jgi:hypothetical protein
MIKINITYDIIIKVDDARKLQDGLAGIYVFLDENNDPLYVGQSTKLKERIASHLYGITNSRNFYKDFRKVALIFEEDSEKRHCAEIYLINTFEGLRNIASYFPDGRKTIKEGFDGVELFGRCQGVSGNGNPCSMKASSNGFCHKHGGNRVTLASIQAKAVEDFLKKHDHRENTALIEIKKGGTKND